MRDTDEHIASLRAALFAAHEPRNDEEITLLRAALDTANHRIKCLEAEVRGLYGKIELMQRTISHDRPC